MSGEGRQALQGVLENIWLHHMLRNTCSAQVASALDELGFEPLWSKLASRQRATQQQRNRQCQKWRTVRKWYKRSEAVQLLAAGHAPLDR